MRQTTPAVDESNDPGDEVPAEVRKEICVEISRRIGEQRRRLPVPRGHEIGLAKQQARLVNACLRGYEAGTIDEVNDVLYAAALTVLHRAGLLTHEVPHSVNRSSRDSNSEAKPPWERRIEGKINDLRRDIAHLQQGHRRRQLRRKLGIGPEKTEERALEELKQKLKAQAGKLVRYRDRVQRFRANRLFQTNQRQLYRQLEDAAQPRRCPSEEEIAFWERIWTSEMHAPGPIDLRTTAKQDGGPISKEQLNKALRRMKSWKAPGPDELHGYWLKAFTSMHDCLLRTLNHCVIVDCPQWMATGRTVLLPKATPGDTRPITCLNTTWKLLTSVMAEDIGAFLEENGLLPEEQKGCRRGTRGSKDLLKVDQAVVEDCKRRKTNLSMAWIDFSKAYDTMSHGWILQCLAALGVADQWVVFLTRTMAMWRTQVGGREIRLRRGIFQGDSLAPLLFVAGLVPVIRRLNELPKGYQLGRDNHSRKVSNLWYMDDCKVFARSAKQLEELLAVLQEESRKTGMDFGLKKCAVLHLKRGKPTTDGSCGTGLPDGRTIHEVDHSEGYKYLGLAELDRVNQERAKEKTRREFRTRVRKVLKCGLNAENTIKAINTWAVPVFVYPAGILRWTKAELRNEDIGTRKLLAAERALNRHGDVDRLYLPRREGGKGLRNLEEVVTNEELAVQQHVHAASDRSLLATAKEFTKPPGEDCDVHKQRVRKERRDRFETKALHGKWHRLTKGQVSLEDTYAWLRGSGLKKETEALLLAAQEQALRLGYVAKHIFGQQVDDRCRVCRWQPETVEHVVSGCGQLAQRDYKRRHDKLAQMVHWSSCRQYGIKTEDKWYQHVPQDVSETKDVKLLWDFDIFTDKGITARRPDIVVVDKKERRAVLIDVSVPIDRNVRAKEDEKVEKYTELALEVKRLWKLKSVEVVPIVIGALGAVSTRCRGFVSRLGLQRRTVHVLQKSALLGTARILRKVLSLHPSGSSTV